MIRLNPEISVLISKILFQPVEAKVDRIHLFITNVMFFLYIVVKRHHVDSLAKGLLI